MSRSTGKHGDYGIDAPPVIRNLILAGTAAIVAGIVLHFALASVQSLIAVILLIGGLVAGASMIVTAGLMVWSSKVGKLQVRERLIDSLALRGTETVLDVGCGRGLLLNAAARRLATGKAIGIDLWHSAAAARAKVIDFFYHDPVPALVEVVHLHGALACWQVGSLEEAATAVNMAGRMRRIAYCDPASRQPKRLKAISWVSE